MRRSGGDCPERFPQKTQKRTTNGWDKSASSLAHTGLRQAGVSFVSKNWKQALCCVTITGKLASGDPESLTKLPRPSALTSQLGGYNWIGCDLVLGFCNLDAHFLKVLKFFVFLRLIFKCRKWNFQANGYYSGMNETVRQYSAIELYFKGNK